MPKAKQSSTKSKASPAAASAKPAVSRKKVATVKAKPASVKKSDVPVKSAVRPVVPAVAKPALAVAPKVAPVRHASVARTIEVAAAPTAATCPLVLDGELSAARFSPKNCLSCDEFDCRFCLTEEGSGGLASLFGDEESDEIDEVDGFSFDRESGGRDDAWDDSSEDDY